MIEYLFSVCWPDLAAFFILIPFIRWYIRRGENTRYCANCQQPIAKFRNGAFDNRSYDTLRTPTGMTVPLRQQR